MMIMIVMMRWRRRRRRIVREIILVNDLMAMAMVLRDGSQSQGLSTGCMLRNFKFYKTAIISLTLHFTHLDKDT